jgi:hypothetical protein
MLSFLAFYSTFSESLSPRYPTCHVSQGRPVDASASHFGPDSRTRMRFWSLDVESSSGSSEEPCFKPRRESMFSEDLKRTLLRRGPCVP